MDAEASDAGRGDEVAQRGGYPRATIDGSHPLSVEPGGEGAQALPGQVSGDEGTDDRRFVRAMGDLLLGDGPPQALGQLAAVLQLAAHAEAGPFLIAGDAGIDGGCSDGRHRGQVSNARPNSAQGGPM